MSPWVRHMLQQHGYYYTPADLQRVEHWPPRQRSAELAGIYNRVNSANQIRLSRDLPIAPPRYRPAGPLFDARLRNPQDFLFGAEAQEVVEPEYVHKAKRRRKKRFVDPRYAGAELEQESFFGTPVQWPEAPLPIGHKRESDYRGWLRYYRSLKDVRLISQWDWFLAKGNWGLSDPILAAAKAGLYQAMVERGMIGGEGQQIDQLTFHTLRRTNPSDHQRRSRLRDGGMTRPELLHHLVRSGEAGNMAETLAGRRKLVVLSYLVAAAELGTGMEAPDGEYGPNRVIVDPGDHEEEAAREWSEESDRAMAVIYYEYGAWPYRDYDFEPMFALDGRALELRGDLVPAYIENANSAVGVVWQIG